MGPSLKPIPFCGVDAVGRWPDVVGCQNGFPGTAAATRPAGAAPAELMAFLLRPRAPRTWDGEEREFLGQVPDLPEGMVGWNPFLVRGIGDQRAMISIHSRATHQSTGILQR